MQQLTLFCSDDLEDRVVSALEEAGVEAFLQLGGGRGRAFNPRGEARRTADWEALVFVVPAALPSQIEQIVAELGDFADRCETGPCLRIVASPVDRLL